MPHRPNDPSNGTKEKSLYAFHNQFEGKVKGWYAPFSWLMLDWGTEPT